MNTYKFTFHGRQNGAIGIKYGITDTYEANQLGEALYMVYTDYDVNHPYNVTENGKNIPYQEANKTEFIKTDYKGKRDRK